MNAATGRVFQPRMLLDEEQTLIEHTAREVFADRSPVRRVRELRDARDELGWSRELWAELGELGWLGMALPESAGGLGLGVFELALVMEAAGRTLTPEPLVSLLLGADLLARSSDTGLRERWLAALVDGSAVATLAWREAGGRWDPSHVDTVARSVGGEWRLTGRKLGVTCGHAADLVLVTARSEAGQVQVHAVAAEAAGMLIERRARLDGRFVADMDLADVTASAPLGGVEVVREVLDRATVGVAAEMLGSASAAFEMTLSYLKERHQFGQPIGAFQALQHRAARLFMRLELTRSAVLGAARAADEAPGELPRLASLAKTHASETFVLVTHEAVQMHGGIGMTDEHDIGFFLKRARVAAATLGDAAWHRARWMELAGF